MTRPLSALWNRVSSLARSFHCGCKSVTRQRRSFFEPLEGRRLLALGDFFTIANPASIENAHFGHSVATTGSVTAIGATRGRVSPDIEPAGRVTIVNHGGGTSNLVKPNSHAEDRFGWSVDVDGSLVIAGAFGDNTNGFEAGAAYLYNTSGVLQRTYFDPSPAANEIFGWAVAISGSNVAITNASQDKVYIYNTSGALLRTINDPNPGTSSQFGTQLSMSGNLLLVGDSGQSSSTMSGYGEAYLFDVTTGSLLRTYANPTPSFDERFGVDVAIDGTKVLIGCSGENTSNGAAYLYNTAGTLLHTFNDPTPATNGLFGWGVGLSGDRAVIGSLSDDSVSIYDADNFSLVRTITPPEGSSNVLFGANVAISSTRAIVADEFYNTASLDAVGRAYSFDVASSAPGGLSLTLSPTTINETSSASISASFVNQGWPDAHEIDINWGDGSVVQEFTIGAGSTGFSATSHQYKDDSATDTYTITVTITSPGGSTSGTRTVTVRNLNPTISNVTNTGPTSEGSAATVTVTASDIAGVLDPMSYEFDFDNNGMYEVGPQSASSAAHTFADNGTYQVNVRVTDGDGGSATSFTTVTVNNVAPSVALALSSAEINEHESTTLTGTFNDPGTLDTFTLNLNWGDALSPNPTQSFTLGTTALTVAANGINWNPVTREFSLPHQYLDDNPTATGSDEYTISATVTDDDGGVATSGGAPITSPDAFGYVAYDHPFESIDLQVGQPGVFTVFDNDDDNGTILDLGSNTFTTTEFGEVAQLLVGTNGHFNAGPGFQIFYGVLQGDWFTNADSSDVILGKYEDLDGDLIADRLIIEWSDVFGCCPNGPQITFQAILEVNTGSDLSNVIFNYPNITHSYLNEVAFQLGGFTVIKGYEATSPHVGNGQAILISSEPSGVETKVTVNNVAPAVDLSLSSGTISENSSTTLTGTITDVGTLDTFTLDLNWGDSASLPETQTFTLGTTALSVAEDGINWNPATRVFSLPHQYLDDNPSDSDSDLYTITVNVTDDDGSSLAEEATIGLTVENLNPVAAAQTASTTEDILSTPINVLAGLTDVGTLDTHTAVAASGAVVGGGLYTLAEDGSLTLDPNGEYEYLSVGQSVTRTISFTIVDDDGGSSTETVTITVNGVNDAPLANPDTNSTTEHALVTTPVLGNDTDVDQADVKVLTTFSIASMTFDVNGAAIPVVTATVTDNDGSIVFNPGNDFDFLPAGATATVVINYTMRDGRFEPLPTEITANSSSTLTITVNGENDAPVGNGDSYSTAEDTPLIIAAPGVLGNDTDVDFGTNLTVFSFMQPAHGTVAVTASGSFTYTPNADYNGPDSFRYRTSDGIAQTSFTTVTLTVTAADDYDFGDAPASYGVASHFEGAGFIGGVANSGPLLGTRDFETANQPSVNADGDDLNSTDDEDGVSFSSTTLVPRFNTTITVNASAAGKLDAWIDFNRNNVFDVGEKIANGLSVVAGSNTLVVPVPDNLTSGVTYARFRISSAGISLPTGLAADGEVEDYKLSIQAQALNSAVVIDDPENPGSESPDVLVIKGTDGFYEAIAVRITKAATLTAPAIVTVYIAPNVSIGSFPLNSFGRIVVFG